MLVGALIGSDKRIRWQFPGAEIGKQAVRAAETGHARPRYRRDDARLHIYLADDVIVALRKVEIAFAIEGQLVGRAEGSRDRRPAIASICALPVAGNGSHLFGRQIQAADPLVIHIAEIQRSIRP